MQARLAIITDAGSDDQRGKLITWMMSTQRFGILFAPAIGGFAAGIDIRAPFVIQGTLVLIALLPSFKLVKETAPPKEQRTAAAQSGDWSYVFSELLKPPVLFFLAAQLFANLTRGSIQHIIVLYAAFAYDKGPQALGLMAAAHSAIVLPLGFMTGYIMDRWGRKKTIVPGFTGLFFAGMFLASTAVFEASFGVFLIGYFALHISQGITAGNMQVLGSDLSPVRARGRFFGIWRLIGQLGNATSPVIFSTLAAISYAASFGFIGFSGLAVALIVGVKVKETIGRPNRAPDPEPAPPPAGAATADSEQKPP